MSRLIVLSNRIPTDATPSGGLVVALHDCLSARGGVWIGSSDHDVAVAENTLRQISDEAYERLTFDLTKQERDGFYLGYANSVLWPLFHWRSDLIEMNDEHARAYAQVNRRVAAILADCLRPDDLLWVHDYHFLPIAYELRALGVTARIGFFLHTPFPHAQDLLALSERTSFVAWLAAYDVVGLQTERDVASLLELYRSEPKAEMLRSGAIKFQQRRFRVLSVPIGIDVDEFVNLAETSDGAALLGLDPEKKLIVGVDRLDYSKGLVNRFEAFNTYLDRHDGNSTPATFLQIAQPSREAIGAYQDIREELERATGRINGAHATLDWTPIRYISQSVPRARLAGLYRRANVGLVTPLADGMNLVAKEYVAAQRPDDPGVLILSHFAGAAEQLPDALMVNPYDTSDMADAIAHAFEMDKDERIERHARMVDILRREDISWWTSSFLDQLAPPAAAAAE